MSKKTVIKLQDIAKIKYGRSMMVIDFKNVCLRKHYYFKDIKEIFFNRDKVIITYKNTGVVKLNDVLSKWKVI